MSRRRQLDPAAPATAGALAIALVVMAAATLTGCGEDGASTETSDELVTAAPMGSAVDLPDFHAFMVGDTPETPAVDRDPFAQPAERGTPRVPRQIRDPVAPSQPVLRGVIERDGDWVAVFAQGSARAGERVGGWEIVSVDATGVEIARGSKRQRLSW